MARKTRSTRKLGSRERRVKMQIALRHYDNKCAMAFCRHVLDARGAPEWRPTLDHICPVSWGGSDRTYNLRPVCAFCHRRLNLFGQCAGAVICAMLTPRRMWKTTKLWAT